MQLCCNKGISLLFLPAAIVFTMKNIKYLTNNSDFLGVITCSLCLLHCICTPLILISYSTLITEFTISYSWWKNLDYVFIFISFFMVFFSTKITKVKTMKYLFWFSWIILFMVIINEKLALFQLSEYITYLATIVISLLHFFNLKHCK